VSFNSGNAGTFKRNAGGASLKVTLPLDSGVTLRSITALRAYRDDPTVVDFGGLEVQRFAIAQNVAQQAFSQEVQLQGKVDALAWTTGAMLVRDRFDFNRYTTAAPLAAPAPAYTEANTHLDTTDIGAYGQLHWALDAGAGLTFGVRAYHTRQSGANQFWRTSASRQRTAQVYNAADLSSSESGLLPKLGADITLSAATFAYASIARGEKFGGFNRAAESLLSAQVAARPEKVTTYELGLKRAAPGGLFSANLAVFYNDYRDYLASLSNTRVNGVQVNDVVLINAGKARTYGADLELAARLAERTRWTLTMELLRSRFTEFANPTGAAATNYVGNELPNAPRLTLGTTLDHTIALADGASVALDLSAQYLRRSFNDVANTVALAMPNQVYLNASATWRPAHSHWSFQLRGKNLGDKAYVLQRTTIASLGVDSAYYNPPRAVQLSARYTF
jgi:iron complex outermembrane receptor protein